MKIIIVYDNEKFCQEIEYVFNLFFSILGVDYEILPFSQFGGGRGEEASLLVSYGQKVIDGRIPCQIHIYSSDFFGENYLKPESLPVLPLKKTNDLPIIFSGQGLLPQEATISENLLETNVDIVAGAFFMLTRYEEFLPGPRDGFGRFPAALSLAFRAGFSSRPVVNEYLELLWRWIDNFGLGFERRKLWPEGKEFAVALTHDIDAVQKHGFRRTLKRAAGLALKRGNFQSAGREIGEYARLFFRSKNSDPYWTFDEIMALEREHGFKSSFYFFASPQKEYSIREGRIKSLLSRLEEDGFEVGLHGSFESADNCEIMKEEKSALEKAVGRKCDGARQHGLKWRPETWRFQAEAEFWYDSSVGYIEDVGFRTGLCLPFRPFDLSLRETLDIWELSLMIMDSALLRQDNRNLTPEQAAGLMEEYIQTARKHGGALTILWHNYSFGDSGHRGWGGVYEKTLDLLVSLSALVGPARDIIDWWNISGKTHKTNG